MTALIKVKVQRKAIVKFKVLTLFPADVVSNPGITITRSGRTYTFSLDADAALGHMTALTLALGGAALGTNILAVSGTSALLGGASLGGAAIGGNALAVTGTSQFNSAVTFASTINKVTLTQPATGATITIPDGVTMTGPAASGTVMTLGNVESVTGPKTFANNGGIRIAGSSTGVTLFASANAGASNFTLTFPAATDTISALGQTQTWTGANTFPNSGGLRVQGAGAGVNFLATANAGASNFTNTFPAANDTLVGKATTDTLTNKTFDTAGTGNSLLINGVAVTANTGTGAVVRTAAPSISGATITTSTYNGNTWTAGTGILTLGALKTFAVNNTLTLAGTDSTTITFQGTDTYVGRATTDTLTNKSMSGASNTFTNIGGTSIRMGSDAQGDILYFNGTNYVRLPAGSSGNFLKTLGAGANPAWAATPGGGDMLAANNLSELTATAQTAQANIGLRKVLTSGLTLFVDNALGNDANAGTASGASAKKTLQSAWDSAVNNYDFRGNALDINVADATYGAGIITIQTPMGCTTIRINGNITTPANVFISATVDSAFRFQVGQGCPIQIKGMKLKSTAGILLDAGFGSIIYFTDKMEFNTTSAAQIQSSNGAAVVHLANYTINGSATQDHHHVINGGTIGADGMTVTLTGTPNFGGAFVGAAGCSFASYTSTTFSGSGTGTRYNIHGQSFVKTAAATPSTFFPGNVAGTSDGGNLDDDCMGGAWIAFSPTPTPNAGAMTASSSGAYKRVGGSGSKMITFRSTITITAAGTGTGTMTMALPIGVSNGVSVGLAVDLNVTGHVGRALINNGATSMTLLEYDGSTTMIHTGSVIGVSGTYEIT